MGDFDEEIIDYPRGMPLPIRADKNMTIDTGFRTDQPQVGAPIFQPLTDDLKTVWSVRWVLRREQERRFAQWLRSPNYLDNGTSLSETEMYSQPVRKSNLMMKCGCISQIAWATQRRNSKQSLGMIPSSVLLQVYQKI